MLAGCLSAVTFAQEADGGADSIEEIVVTGSRLIRRDLVSPSPIVTLTGSDVDVSGTGNATLEETLNEWPQLVADNTSSLNAPGGSGVLTADLRGLGSERTLVLVDGRRFVPGSASGLVDLASIPTALVESVEIITGGASAVYGSDAIAGAINFKLRDDLEGLETDYTYMQSGEEDGNTHQVTVNFGTQLADGRGHAIVSTSYTNRDPVFFADRAFSAIPLIDGDGVNLVPSGSGNIPGTGVRLSGPQIAQLNGVDLTNTDTDFGVGPQGSCTNVAGIRFGQGGEVLPFCRPENNYNFAAANYLLRPLERVHLTALSELDLTENTRAFAQLFFTHKENAFQRAPESVTLESSGAPGGTLLVPNAATNPLFTQPVRDFFANNTAIFDQDGDGTAEIINAGRRFEEIGPRESLFTTKSYNVTLGLEGTVDVLSKDWSWNVFGQSQRADEDSLTTNQVSSLRLALGLDVVTNGSGDIVCRNEVIGCVPVNPFGIGSITPEMAEFLATPSTVTQVFERSIVGGSIAGNLFEVTAGDIPFAVGFEFRKDEFQVLPDAVNLTDQVNGSITDETAGDVDVFEVFMETRVPLISDVLLVDELAIEAAARFSDYSTVGNVSTWKGGIDWRVNDALRLRAMYNRAIRAPSLNELFSPSLNTSTGATDPCDSRLNPSQAVKDFCVETGVPQDVIDTFLPTNPEYDQLVGGNPDLMEETSDTVTYGFVIAPSFMPGLDLSVDYYNVDVEDAISVVSAQVVLNTCFALRDPDSPFCQSISRFPTGVIQQFDSRNQNFASLTVRGIDVQAGYSMDLPAGLALPGASDAVLDLRVVANWQLENSEKPLPNEADIECAGHFAGPCSSQDVRTTPDHSGSFTSSYTSGPASLRAQVRWIGDLELFPGAVRAVQEIDPAVYVDLSGAYEVIDNLQVYAGINNVFDEQPTIVGFFAGGDPNVDPSTYDVVGRRFFVGLKTGF